MTQPRNEPLDANSLFTHIQRTPPKRKTKQTALHPGDLIHVMWEDALTYGCEQWENGTTPQLATTHSVGWIIDTNQHDITIVTLVNEHAYGNGITIPTGTIKHITKIDRKNT